MHNFVCMCLHKNIPCIVFGTCSELCLNCVDDEGVAILCTGQLSLETLDLSNSSITLLRYVRIPMQCKSKSIT